MSIDIPQGITSHVLELCQAHDLFEPNSTKLKENWESNMEDIIKDSRFVVIGQQKICKDLSAIVVQPKSLPARIFWGTIGVFTPSYWDSRFATEDDIKEIFRAVLEREGPQRKATA